MGSPVSVQLLAFGQSILLGLSAGVLYDVLRPFRLRCPRITTLLPDRGRRLLPLFAAPGGW